MPKVTPKQNRKAIDSFEKQFRSEKSFPSLSVDHQDMMLPIMHTGYLMFIRSKFLFLGILKSFEDRNLFVTYSVIKSYWENVTAFGYYIIKIEKMIKEDRLQEAFGLARKIGLGGRGFVTEEMVIKKGRTIEDFTIPNIYTMMELVDKDFQKILGTKDSMFRELYDWQIAEGGHTTFIGLSMAGRWNKAGTELFPDPKRSWDRFEYNSLLNLTALASQVFFIYWAKFRKLGESNT